MKNKTEFKEIYDQNKDRVYTIAYRYLQDKDSAFDVSQEVFIKMYSLNKKFNTKNEENSYISRMTVNKSIDHIRKIKPFTTLNEDIELPSLKETSIDKKDEVNFLLKQISKDQRLCVILKDIMGHTIEECATICGIEIGTVKSRLSRARDIMKNMYKKEEAL